MRSARPPLAAPTEYQSRAIVSLNSALALCTLMAVALGLRLFRLGDLGFLHDEVISRFAALAPAPDIFSSITAVDSHPPLYHILLHLWGAIFGYELLSLRLMSVALGLLCVPAAWQLGRSLLGPQAGLIAATLIAVSPFQILHSQQARMYPLLTLLVLLSTLAFLVAWRHGGAWRWGLLGLLAAAGFYTHVYYAFSLLGLNLWALSESVRLRRLERGQWAGSILAQSAAVALFGPFMLTMLTLTSGVIANFWIRSDSALDWLFALIALLNYATRELSSPTLWYLLLVYLPALCAIMFGVAYAVVALRREPDERPVWSLLLFGVFTPCLVAVIVSHTVRPILLDRSLIGVSGPLCILVAGALARTWSHRLAQLLAASLALSIAIVLPAVYPAAPRPHSLQPALDIVFTERRAGDAVIVLDWQSFDLIALRYPEAQEVYVGGPTEKVAYWQRRMTFMRWHTPEQVGPLEGYAGRYSRIWVVQTTYTYQEDWEPVRPWLQANMQLVGERKVDKATLLLYERRP